MKHPHSATPLTATFGLLRHGQTQWNIQNKVQGSADSPLTSTGKKQTAEWRRTLENFRWDSILSSDLGRARQTVGIINETLALPVHFDQRLREQCWGEWEGLTIPFITERFPDELARQIARGWEFTPPGGESRSSVISRVLAALADAGARRPGRRILVVCHQGVIKAVLYHLTQREFLPGEDPLLQHDRLHLIHCVDGQFRPGKLNIPRLPES